MTMPLLFFHSFARSWLHGFCWTFIPCLPYLPLQTETPHLNTVKSKTLSNSRQRCSLLLTNLWPPHLPSTHGIKIISRASLCCCMEGMGVFELDLLDNIRSTQISFHARLFHAARTAHSGMLIWLLLFWESLRGKPQTHQLQSVTLKYKGNSQSDNRIILWLWFMFSFSQAAKLSAFPSVCWDPFTGRGTGKADFCRQTAHWCCCFLWHDGLALSVAILAKLLKREIRSGFLFWFPQTSYLWVSWVESSCRRQVQRRDDTLWLQVIISTYSRDPPWKQF